MNQPPTRPGPDQPPTPGLSARSVLAALAVLKLVLVSHEEVRTAAADDRTYALMAGAWYWGNPYLNQTYSRQPVYPIFIALGTAFGIPARLWMEGAWIAAAALVACALVRAGVGRWWAVAVYGLLVFEPATMMLFNRLGPDGLYAAATVALVAAIGAAIAAPSPKAMWKWGGAASILAAVAANVRQESITTYALLAGGGAAAWWATRPRPARAIGPGPRTRSRQAAVALVPILVAMLTSQGIALANKHAIGAAVPHDLALPGFRSLYRALLAVPPAHPDPRLPVPRDVRERAYEASPSFAELRPALDGEGPERINMPVAERATGITGEYGSWTVWAIRRAAWGLRQWPNARELDQFYARCAAELRAAMADGRLAHRWVPVDFVPPEWAGIVRVFPESLGRALRVFAARVYESRASAEIGETAEAQVTGAALRRTTLESIAAGNQVAGSFWHAPAMVEAMARARSAVATTFQRLFWICVPLVAAGAVGRIAGLRRGLPAPERSVIAVEAMLLFVIVSRLLLVALLDATGVPAEARYAFVAQAAWWVLAVLGARAAVVALRPTARMGSGRSAGAVGVAP